MALYNDVPVAELWDQFIQSGVSDTLTILQYVSSVLAGADPPPLFSTRSNLLRRVVMALKLGRDGSPGEFLNDYLLFVPQAQYPDGQFPLPRHLTRTMVTVAQVGPSDRVLDLACGTGGLLVAAKQAGAAFIEGLDIDARMAQIAGHNARLNPGQGEVVVRQADATMLPATPIPPTVTLLAPAFGARTFDRQEAGKMLGYPVSRIETALADMALQRLDSGGRAALLVAARLLSGGDAADRRLRKQIIDQYRLKAVVKLPAAALQPYSNTQVYLLLVEKRTPADDDLVWFAAPQRDGYGVSRTARRLTEPLDPERNDYPLVEALLTQSAIGQHNQPLPDATDPVLSVAHRLAVQGDGRPAVEGVGRPALHVITPRQGWWFARGCITEDEAGKWLVVAVAGEGADANQRYVAVRLGHNERAIELHTWPEDSVQPLFDEPIPGGAIAIRNDGVLFAVARTRSRLARQADEGKEVDLRPETYIPQPPEGSVAPETTAELLDRLRKNGSQFEAALTRLISHVDRTLLRATPAPAVLSELADARFPLGKPSRTQADIWASIQAVERTAPGEGGARFFTVRHLEDWLDPTVLAEVGATLELLCRVGAIVPVTVRETPGYRLATTWDTWRPAPAEERREGTDAPEGTARA